MNTVGSFSLFLAWLFALFGFIGGAYAGKSGSRQWFTAVQNATVSGSSGRTFNYSVSAAFCFR